MNDKRFPFFVYGTLLPGQPNAYLWADSVTKAEVATLPGGRLYDMGAYPMLVAGGAADMVVGVVQTVAEVDYEAVMTRLDYLEGYDPQRPDEFGYRREVREVVVANASTEHGRSGRSLQAWVYIGQLIAVRGLIPIAGGDWAAYVGGIVE